MQRRHKLWLTAAVLLLLLSCLLAGCAGDTGHSDDMVARSDYEAVCAERDQLAAELAQATGDMVRAQLGGSFQATVRGVIPVSYTHLIGRGSLPRWAMLSSVSTAKPNPAIISAMPGLISGSTW